MDLDLSPRVYIAAANEILAIPEIFNHFDLDKIRCQDIAPRLNINCICGVTIGYNSALWNVLRRNYPDFLNELRQRYGIPDTSTTNRELIATVVRQIIKRVRASLVSDGMFLTNPNAKTLMYRFVAHNEFVVVGATVSLSLRTFYDRGFITHQELRRSGIDTDIVFTFQQGQYQLRSAGKRNISLMEYLSTSLGRGGHISGWQYYSGNMNGQIGSVSAGYRAFSDHGNRPLFVFQAADLRNGDIRHALLPRDRYPNSERPIWMQPLKDEEAGPQDDNDLSLEAGPQDDNDRSGQIVRWVNIDGEYGRYVDDELGRSGTVTTHWVPYEPGVIKMVQAGILMPGEAGNSTEVDLIGEADLYGCVIMASRPSAAAYELLMSALQRSNIVSLMMPLGAGLPDVDVPAPIPDDY